MESGAEAHVIEYIMIMFYSNINQNEPVYCVVCCFVINVGRDVLTAEISVITI